MTGRLIQVSGVIVDLVYRVDAVPAPGTEAIVHGFAIAAGGGFNAMVAARRMGAAVAHAGTLGTGPFADIAAAALAREGIAQMGTRLSGRDQGLCTVLIDAAGERSFIAAEGADGVLTDADLARLRPGAEDWLLLSGYALHYAGSRAALVRWLAARPPRLVFDPSPVIAAIPEAARQAALAAALWITANREEGAVLTGLADPGAMAAALARGRPAGGGAILRDGANGCHIALAGGPARHLPGFPVRAVDTNGAGDAHTGAFIARLIAGDDPERAAHLANVCAALSTTQEGPSTAPDLTTVLAAMDTPPEAASEHAAAPKHATATTRRKP